MLRIVFGKLLKVARNPVAGVMCEGRRIKGSLYPTSNSVMNNKNCAMALGDLNCDSDLQAVKRFLRYCALFAAAVTESLGQRSENQRPEGQRDHIYGSN